MPGTTIFATGPGRVVALPPDATSGSLSGTAKSVRLTNWDDGSGGGFTTFKSIITRIGIGRGSNFNVQPSLDRLMYLYVYGDRVGQVLISGLCFDGQCGDEGRNSGLAAVHDFYRKNRLALRSDPLILTVGYKASFTCFLSDLETDSGDTNHLISQFNMKLVLIPDDDYAQTQPGSSDLAAAAPGVPFFSTTTSPTTHTFPLYPGSSDQLAP